MNRALLLSILIFACYSEISGQDCIAEGLIKDKTGTPLAFATIIETGTENGTTTNFDGYFSFALSNCDSALIEISYVGYKTREVLVKPDQFNKISLVVSEAVFGYPTPDDYFKNHAEFKGSLVLDFTFPDFTEFRPNLGEHGVDQLNDLNFKMLLGFEGSYTGFIGAFHVGFGETEITEPDSLGIKVNRSFYRLSTGYYLINTRGFQLAPEASLYWQRYRLLNFDTQLKIPLQSYLEDRDLDIRFNQLLWYAGLRAVFIIHSPTPSWAIEAYAGYIDKLSEYPWIYSRGNRLTNNNKIIYEPVNFGITLSLTSF